MKKLVPILAMSLLLASCTNTDTNSQEANNESVENKTQVIDVAKKDTSEEKNEEAIDDSSNQNDSQTESENVDTKEQPKETEVESENVDKEESDEKETEAIEKSSDEVSKDQLFYLPYGSFASVNENGEIVDENGNVSPDESSSSYSYVKYTNNIFVSMKSDLYDSVKIVRMNDKSVETLYEFPEVDDFRPLGMIGDKIYGFHDYNKKAEINGTPTLETEKSAIGYIDLATGENHDYEATVDVLTGDAVVIDGELQFTKPGDNSKEDAYNYDLYKLDLSKGLYQEAELVEKDFNLQYLFGQKRFVDGKPVWKILRADNDNLYANDQKFPFMWAETGSQEIIGNNVFYFSSEPLDGEENDRLTRTLTVMNLSTGKTVLEKPIRGLKIHGNKLYYLTKDNDLESVEIEL